MIENNQTENETVADTPRPKQDRKATWVVLGLFVGLLVPVVICSFVFIVTFVGMGFIAGRGSTSSVGFGDAVAIVNIDGVITSGDNSSGTIGAISGIVINDLEAAEKDPTVKAIVVRVDSPGGTVTGATQIYEVIKQIDKPLVVSMASVAASGGYYVSAPTDFIFARADTLTGSIGVISTFINAEQLLDEIGVEAFVMASGPNKDFGSLWSGLSPEQQGIWQGIMDEFFEDFVAAVAEGRGLAGEDLSAVTDGRVFSGRQAMANGLVDDIGNLQDAIDKAAELGGVTGEPRIIEYAHSPRFSDFLLGMSNRFQTSRADEIMELVWNLTTPKIEYRYMGPQ
jgi:protease-4